MMPMESEKILRKDHLVPLLRKLARDYRLVAPVRNRYGDTLYSVVDDLDSAAIDLDNRPLASLKQFFFPQEEPLSGYIAERDGPGGELDYTFHPRLPENVPTVYFGVRSCDMFAVMYTDMIFLHGREHDLYYRRRRENAVFITLGCSRPFADCFCRATRTGPFLETGFDLQLTDLGSYWLVETGRPRGMKILQQWPLFFARADDEDRRKQFQVNLEARGLFNRPVLVDLAIRLLEEGRVDEQIFHDLSARCQDCGGCAYICPTCTCYDIQDRRLEGGSGERVRTWDACTFAGFTRMAGDHNPVDPERGRIRRRFLHKLLHDVRRHGRPSCVGCGRCVGICFGGVDIVRFIDLATRSGEREFAGEE
jgi:ferredoxin